MLKDLVVLFVLTGYLALHLIVAVIIIIHLGHLLIGYRLLGRVVSQLLNHTLLISILLQESVQLLGGCCHTGSTDAIALQHLCLW